MRLLDTTDLLVAQIALQAGFSSLRRFNTVFAEVYGRPPTTIRRQLGNSAEEQDLGDGYLPGEQQQ